jgi:cation:H+ antiporter
VVYLAYATSFFRKRYIQIGKEQQEEESFSYRFLRKFNHIDAAQKREFGKLFVGIALMLFSADMIVKMATQLAEYAHMPEFLIGLVVVAIGTSLPELAFSIRSLEDHEPSMFFGNLLGSTIANSTLVIGIVSVIRPIELVAKSEYTIATASFVVVFLLFWLFVRSKHRLDRIEALGLIIAYLVFVAIEFSIGA